MKISQKELAAGGFFVAVGLYYGGTTWKTLPIGQARDMGPGYLPFILSGLLVILGSGVLARGLFAGIGTQLGIIPWRAIIMMTTATILFATFVRELGLFPTIFLSLMIASLSTPTIKVTRAAIVSFCTAVFCVLVFSYGVGLPVPVFGSWFGR